MRRCCGVFDAGSGGQQRNVSDGLAGRPTVIPGYGTVGGVQSSPFTNAIVAARPAAAAAHQMMAGGLSQSMSTSVRVNMFGPTIEYGPSVHTTRFSLRWNNCTWYCLSGATPVKENRPCVSSGTVAAICLVVRSINCTE